MNSITIVREKSKGLHHIEFFLILFYTLFYMLPKVNTIVPMFFSLTIGICYMVYLIFKNVLETRFLIKLILSSIALSLIYFILTETQTINSLVSNYFIKVLVSKVSQIIMGFLPVVFFARVITRADAKQKNILLTVALILFAFIVINTSIELAINESATRNWADFENQSDNNVGTYSFVYAVSIAIILLPCLLRESKSTLIKFILILAMVLLFVFLLFAQYTLALLIALIGLLFQYTMKIKELKYRILLWIFAVLFLVLMPNLFSLIADFVPAEQMAIRLREISAFMSSGDTSGYNLGSRLELYMQTIQAFVKSPILGNKKLGFDGHATFLTVFADIGIFGGSLYVYVYVMSKNLIKNNMSAKQRNYYLPVFIGFILMGLTNPIHSAQTLSFMVWFVAPLLICCCTKNKGEKK